MLNGFYPCNKVNIKINQNIYYSHYYETISCRYSNGVKLRIATFFTLIYLYRPEYSLDIIPNNTSNIL